MAREIIERIEYPKGVIALVADPHDGSGKPRWFVEQWTQVKYDDEAAARVHFEALKTK